MTISSTLRKAGPYVGNGVATSFVFSFKVFDASEIVVTRTSVTAGTETVLVLTTDYTVTLNADQNTNPGGTVTYNPSGVPMTSTYNLTITSDVLQTQETDIPNAGGWYPEVAEDAWDKNTILTQQLKEVQDRTLQFPVADANPPQLPAFSARANRVLGFDGNGALTTYPTTSGVIAGSFADTTIATAGQTVIPVRAYVMGVNTLAVFLNGVRQEYGVDYTETTTTSYTFVSGLTAGDKVISVIGQEQAGVGAVDSALVSYLPAIGQTPTDVETKLRESVSVKDFGVIGDGSDETTKIIAAIDFAMTGNLELYFPPGTYGVNKTVAPTFGLYMNQPCKLRGAGIGRTILKNLSATAALLRCGVGYIDIEGMTLDANGSSGISFQMYGQSCSVKDIRVTGQTGSDYAFQLLGCTQSYAENIFVDNCTYGALCGNGTYPLNYVTLVHLNTSASTGVALNLGNNSNCRYVGTYFESGEQGGITISGSEQVSFFGLSAELANAEVALSVDGHINIGTSKSIQFSGVRFKSDDYTTKHIFQIGANNSNIAIQDSFWRDATSTGMSFVYVGAAVNGLYVERTYTAITNAFTGFNNAIAGCSKIRVCDWVDSSADASHVFGDAVYMTVENVNGQSGMSVTDGVQQFFRNNRGAYSGTGAPIGSFASAMSGAVVHTTTVTFEKLGTHVTLRFATAYTGGASAAAHISFADLPANLKPANDMFFCVPLIKDNGATGANGAFYIDSTGAMDVGTAGYANFTSSAGNTGIHAFTINYLAAH